MSEEQSQSNCGSSHGYDALIAEMRRRLTDADLRHEDFREVVMKLLFGISVMCLLIGLLTGILGTMLVSWMVS